MGFYQETWKRTLGGAAVLLLVATVVSLVAPRLLAKPEIVQREVQAPSPSQPTQPSNLSSENSSVLLPPPPVMALRAEPVSSSNVNLSANEGLVAEKIVPLKPNLSKEIAGPKGRQNLQLLRPAEPREQMESQSSFASNTASQIEAATSPEVGQTLLRILEHGKGPSIEIAWPDNDRERSQLFDHFRDCHGMRIALMDQKGRLFVKEGAAGDAWDINLDRYSGFVRRPSGAMSGEEMKAAHLIKMHHGIRGYVSQVRLFPRTSDAVLLGSFKNVVGPGYQAAQRITAAYLFDGHDVQVDNIVVDGTSVPGRFNLPPQRTCR